MAAKRKRAGKRATKVARSVALTAEAAGALQVMTVRVSAGGALKVSVDVTNPSADYTVAFGKTGSDSSILMFARVDRAETLTGLAPGQYVLGWHFVHFAKGWAHTIAATGRDGEEVLESRSEARKDSPRSVGFALVVVS